MLGRNFKYWLQKAGYVVSSCTKPQLTNSAGRACPRICDQLNKLQLINLN